MNTQTSAILNALKNQALLKYLTPIAEQPFVFSTLQPQHQHARPFELYQYQQLQPIHTDYNALQHRIRCQILYKFNQYLFQEEQAQLQMQLFSLQQSIDIRQNQISFMKLQMENEKINKNMKNSHLEYDLRMQEKKRLARVDEQQIKKKLQMMKQQQQEIEKPSDDDVRSRLKIYSSLNCEIQPDQNPVRHVKMSSSRNRPQNASLKLNLNQLKKSHRQSHAIYSKRSQTYSSDNQQKIKVRNMIKNIEPDKDKTVIHVKQADRLTDLKTIQNQISFYQRAWKDAQRCDQKLKAREFKKKIFEKLQQFWGLKRE